MDNIDGKQARRTGQSSGLGELFEYNTISSISAKTPMLTHDSHGIDSLNCTLASLCETAAVGLGASPKGVFTALIPCLPMFFSTWETYHTHTLYLGYFNGPTGVILLLVQPKFVADLLVRGSDSWMYHDVTLRLLRTPNLDSAHN